MYREQIEQYIDAHKEEMLADIIELCKIDSAKGPYEEGKPFGEGPFQALAKGLISRDIKIVSGGTDNHLMLVDLTTYGLTGKAVEKLLDQAHITCNKNTIPNDPQSPFVTSGVRLGTPAVTSRGMKEDDMDKIAEAIAMVIKGGEEKVPEARAIVQALTDKYPLV